MISDKTQFELFVKWLDGFANNERNAAPHEYSLDGIKRLCEIFGRPERAFNSIHIAGSKGKGSVSVMLASILEACGYKTGLYTSPHVYDIRERVCAPSGFFADSVYAAAAEETRSVVESIDIERFPELRDLTWFELTTLFAFLVFKREKMDWGVFETGLGGRLDATNALYPAASVITPIELEHTAWLGDTIEKIASEKAGIIKTGVPVFAAPQNAVSERIFAERARSTGSRFYRVADYIDTIEVNITPEGSRTRVAWKDCAPFADDLRCTLRLYGTAQAYNAAATAFVIKTLLPQTDESLIARGLEKASLPARFEKTDYRGIDVILDGAHTVASAEETLKTFNALYSSRRAHLLFACAADKNAEGIARVLYPRFERIAITRPGGVKESDLESTRAAFLREARKDKRREVKNVECEYDYDKAIRRALFCAARRGAPLLVCGSFYLAAEVKKRL